MTSYQYRITRHPAEDFSHLVYFCTDQGDCKTEQLPSDQLKVLEDLLNEQGKEGWELIQIAFGKDGLVAFWKRAI
jgi:hypothetical protein